MNRFSSTNIWKASLTIPSDSRFLNGNKTKNRHGKTAFTSKR